MKEYWHTFITLCGDEKRALEKWAGFPIEDEEDFHNAIMDCITETIGTVVVDDETD